MLGHQFLLCESLMSALLCHTSSGIPLSFIVKNELTDWLTQQPSFVQQWLANTDFEKSGLALIPNAETGELSQVF